MIEGDKWFYMHTCIVHIAEWIIKERLSGLSPVSMELKYMVSDFHN